MHVYAVREIHLYAVRLHAYHRPNPLRCAARVEGTPRRRRLPPAPGNAVLRGPTTRITNSPRRGPPVAHPGSTTTTAARARSAPRCGRSGLRDLGLSFFRQRRNGKWVLPCAMSAWLGCMRAQFDFGTGWRARLHAATVMSRAVALLAWNCPPFRASTILRCASRIGWPLGLPASRRIPDRFAVGDDEGEERVRLIASMRARWASREAGLFLFIFYLAAAEWNMGVALRDVDVAWIRIEILNTATNDAIDIFSWAGEHAVQNLPLLPSSPKAYLRSCPADQLHMGRPMEPLTLTHLGLRIPVVLLLAAPTTNRALSYRSIGDYYATVNIQTSMPHIPRSYNVLDTQVLYFESCITQCSPRTRVAFAVCPGNETTVFIPKTCFAVAITVNENIGLVTPLGYKQKIPTAEPIIFDLFKKKFGGGDTSLHYHYDTMNPMTGNNTWSA
ncbi:hypothetical protein BJ912DRAFT_1111052 [Pholiota molesta]|nr:hypothetical protein BJ912DRAFT_1111052 [Pholiota molesta]